MESRFKDAAYYYWLLATETLRVAAEDKEDPGAVARVAGTYADHLHKADLYYAYSFVEDFFLPFTPLRPEVLFQCARFLINGLGGREAPHGVSRVKILYTLAKQAKHLGAFKLARSPLPSENASPREGSACTAAAAASPRLRGRVAARRRLRYRRATRQPPRRRDRLSTEYTQRRLARPPRYAYDKLLHMKVPEEWQEQLDVDMLTIHAKPVRDHPELLPVCYRCGAANALLNPAASAAPQIPGLHIRQAKHYDVCTSCGHPFVRSFLNFEALPLIEFVPEAPLTDEEALDLIREAPPDKPRRGGGARWNEAKDGGADVRTGAEISRLRLVWADSCGADGGRRARFSAANASWTAGASARFSAANASRTAGARFSAAKASPNARRLERLAGPHARRRRRRRRRVQQGDPAHAGGPGRRRRLPAGDGGRGDAAVPQSSGRLLLQAARGGHAGDVLQVRDPGRPHRALAAVPPLLPRGRLRVRGFFAARKTPTRGVGPASDDPRGTRGGAAIRPRTLPRE